MRLAFAMFVAYLIGSIPTGYIIARFTKRIDIRSQGSGNVGATNVFRTVGKIAALATLIIDIFKGFFAVTIWADMAYSAGMSVARPDYMILLGICVVLGHNYSLFLRLKGGKGVATSAGVLLALCPKLLVVGLLIWILAFAITRIVSLASVLATIAIPIGAYFFNYPVNLRIFVVALALLILISHRTNIVRLLQKKENKLNVRS